MAPVVKSVVSDRRSAKSLLQVVRVTGKREEYAEGILGVCRLYARSSLFCVSGVTNLGVETAATRTTSR
jgi:hypothetical protein